LQTVTRILARMQVPPAPPPERGAKISGGYIGGVPPVPIPNTEVKPSRADGTARFPCGRVGRCRNFIETPRRGLSIRRGALFCDAIMPISIGGMQSRRRLVSCAAAASFVPGAVHRSIRAFVLALLLLATLAAGVWFGEDNSNVFPRVWWATLTGVLATAAAWRLTSTSGRWLRTSITVASAAVAVAGFVIGGGEATRAYNECVARGEDIRRELAAYKQQHGHYPRQLPEAIKRSSSCSRALRGSLLQYSATAPGYQLEFGDYLVTFRATDQHEFMATK
jgi:hypothetical protein